MSSPAILGTSVARCRSFEPAIPASGAGSALADIAQGGYALVASVDAWIKIGITGDSVAAVPGTTQPAIDSPNKTTFLPAGVVVPLDVDVDNAKFSVVSATASTGLLRVSGPLTIARAR